MRTQTLKIRRNIDQQTLQFWIAFR